MTPILLTQYDANITPIHTGDAVWCITYIVPIELMECGTYVYCTYVRTCITADLWYMNNSHNFRAAQCDIEHMYVCMYVTLLCMMQSSITHSQVVFINQLKHWWHTYIHIRTSKFKWYVHTYIHTLPSSNDTCLHTLIHTYIHNYVHTYLSFELGK